MVNYTGYKQTGIQGSKENQTGTLRWPMMVTCYEGLYLVQSSAPGDWKKEWAEKGFSVKLI